jgi:hypothetical protein
MAKQAQLAFSEARFLKVCRLARLTGRDGQLFGYGVHLFAADATVNRCCINGVLQPGRDLAPGWVFLAVMAFVLPWHQVSYYRFLVDLFFNLTLLFHTASHGT